MDTYDAPVDGLYSGDGSSIFKLAFLTSLLTLLTLGIYRFWAKTRIRKYIWSSVSFRGDSMEYTGTGLEKFLGFLVAMVILAVYLAIVQMLLFYFGLSLFTEPETIEEMIAQMVAIYATIFAVIPLWFFAIYRARRYKMARTRWRGIRFGMDKGAWGYALRAIWYWFLTISSVGLLLPLQTFKLEQYKTDRSWYGNTQFRQGGKWTALYGAMKHLFIGAGILALAGLLVSSSSEGLGIFVGIVGYVWVIIGGVYYRVRSFGYLSEHKELGGEVRFHSAPRTGHIIKTVILGGLAVGALSGVMFAIAGGSFATAMDFNPDTMQPEFSPAAIVFAALVYALAIMSIGALSLAFITQPVIEHLVQTLKIENPRALDIIRQRAHDEGADAEGFADALDVGGAI